MSSPDPLFRSLWPEGWFASVVSTYEDRVTVDCKMFSRDYDEETSYTDIVLGSCDPDAEPPNTEGCTCVAKFNAVFELSSHGPATLLEQPLFPAWGYKHMPKEVANAIAALVTPANFPEAAEFMVPPPYPEDEDARSAFWASINQQVSSMRTAGDTWGALRLQREAADKLINWVDPPVSPSNSIPEPNLDDMDPPRHSLLEEKEDDFLPVGSHLLPNEFQEFLRGWNKTIAAATGDWLGEPRETYRQQNPEIWQHFRDELKRLSGIHATEVAAVKAYQASPAGKAEALLERAA